MMTPIRICSFAALPGALLVALSSTSAMAAPVQEAGAPAQESKACKCDCDACQAKHGAKTVSLKPAAAQDDLAERSARVAEVLQMDLAELKAKVQDEPKEEAAPLTPEERGYLGVFLGADTGDGAQLQSVIDGSPAAGVGLQAGDIITAAEELPIESNAELAEVLSGLRAGDLVTLEVERDGEEMRMTFALGQRDVLEESATIEIALEEPIIEDFEIVEEPIVEDVEIEEEVVVEDFFLPRSPDGNGAAEAGQRGFLGVYLGEDGGKGAMISSLVDGGAAAGAGLKDGDRVITLNGSPVTNTADLIDAIRGLPAGAKVVLGVQSGNRVRVVEVVLGAREPSEVPPATEETERVQLRWETPIGEELPSEALDAIREGRSVFRFEPSAGADDETPRTGDAEVPSGRGLGVRRGTARYRMLPDGTFEELSTEGDLDFDRVRDLLKDIEEGSPESGSVWKIELQTSEDRMQDRASRDAKETPARRSNRAGRGADADLRQQIREMEREIARLSRELERLQRQMNPRRGGERSDRRRRR